MDRGSSDKSLVECQQPSKFNKVNLDPPPKYCGDNKASLRDVPTDLCSNKEGLGAHRLCDPMQTGNIINDMKTVAEHHPERDVIYKYARTLRAVDEAMLDLFSNIVVIDDNGRAIPVPRILGTQERAVAAIVQTNVRQDNSIVVDRIKLPMIAIHPSGYQMNQQRYIYHQAIDWLRDVSGKPGLFKSEKFKRDTVFGQAWGIPMDISYNMIVWTKYIEDMNQIFEQVIGKFSPIAYITVQGVRYETIVSLDSIANNLDYEPGAQAERVIKFQFGFTVQTFIPQPLVRRKAVLEERVEFANTVKEEEIEEIISRIKVSVKEVE